MLDEVFDEAIPDLAAGKVDGGFFVIGDLIPLIQNDNLRAVLITDISEGADQIVASSEIRSVADLHGKRIGVSLGTFGEVLVRRMLETQKISLSGVTFVDVNAEAVPEAIPSVIDAAHTWGLIPRVLCKMGCISFLLAQRLQVSCQICWCFTRISCRQVQNRCVPWLPLC